MNKFEKLDIPKEIVKSINDLGFKEPTDIQKKSIPHIMKGEDLIGTSATGSGKTLAFGVKAIEVCELNKGTQTLILTPTRELAKQVGNDIKKLSKYTIANVGIIHGGTKLERDIEIIKESNILVSTTGRLLDHIEKNNLDFTNLKLLVLDEADLMIDSEFVSDVEQILSKVPEYAQKVMFSATITEDILKIASKYMNTPKKIMAKFEIDKEKLIQTYYELEQNQKLSLLIHLLKYQKAGLSIVFVNRQDNTKVIAKNIKHFTDLEVNYAHGGMEENKRKKIINDFREEKFDVLVATDVAARGLDINNITHIYNYNLPKDKTKYTHRIGRTARAGKEGKVFNFITKSETRHLVDLVGENFKTMISKKFQDVEQIEPKFKEEVQKGKIIKVGNKKFRR